MRFIGIDLHKKTISLCVVGQDRQLLSRRSFLCADTNRIADFCQSQQPFHAVVEATASYEWLFALLEPLAEQLVLAHPGKRRVIAESTRKTDKIDAQVLAEFLALGMIPKAYRPTPRQRQHRTLVRQRFYLRRRTTSTKNKIRRVLGDYNADRQRLFCGDGLVYLKQSGAQLSPADRFVLGQLVAEWEYHEQPLAAADGQLREFARQAPVREAEARAVLASVPGVGTVTVDIVLCELGDVERFRSASQVVAYAGLAPTVRESAGKAKELGITKQGSRLLRWALVEAAWRLVRVSRRWQTRFETLAKRRGRKKAIVAVARRLLTVLTALLRSGQAYRLGT